MVQNQICNSLMYDRLPPLSPKYPWFVAQTLEEKEKDVNGEQIFYTVQNSVSHYRCRIPELLGRHIRGYSHGWLILSNGDKDKWSLWNPIASNLIRLPRLIMKDGDSDDIGYCCLSSPPYTPDSIFLFMRDEKPKIVFYRLDRKRKKLKWIEMSYSKQLASITEAEDDYLKVPICCNGKVYALSDTNYVIQLDIVAKEKEVVISLLPFSSMPECYVMGRGYFSFLKGSCEGLFIITVGFTDGVSNNLVDVCLFKLDMTSMVWEEMNELKGKVFFVDVDCDQSVDCSSDPIPCESGGYVHILDETTKVMYSYDVKDKSISLSSLHCLDLPPRSGDLRTSHISVWTIPELRLQGDDEESNKCIFDAKQDKEDKENEMVVRLCKNDEVEFITKTNESHLLNIPFHILETIMEFCVGVEYLKFRATCKVCHLVAPVIQWSGKKEEVRRRLQAYSLSSPWLMSFEKDQGIITFTDPIFGDEYFIKASEDLFHEKRILCSKYGWLLLDVGVFKMTFFNPFTGDFHKLPQLEYSDHFSFSAPPTSPDCTVVAFSKRRRSIYVHYVGREQIWCVIPLDFGGADHCLFEFPVFCGRDVYSLTRGGGLQVFKGEDLSLETIIAEAPKSCSKIWREYYLVKCDRHLLLVIVGDFGESVEVFKLKDSTKEWVKVDDLGKHVIYICNVTCVCMDAKTTEMENRIYFPKLRLKNGKMVFYSFETRKYHTINDRNGEENLMDIFETKWKTCPQAWIEPSWS